MDGLALKKYHFRIFSRNLVAVVLAIFFYRAYLSGSGGEAPHFAYGVIILGVFVSLLLYMARPSAAKHHLLPETGFLIMNTAMALIIGLFFISSIGLAGLFFVAAFAFLLSEAEHIVHGIIARGP